MSTLTKTRTTDELIGEQVKVLMWRKGVTQVALARRLNINQGALSRKLHGARAWSADDMRQVAQLLKVGLAELLPPDDQLPHLDSNQKPFGYWAAA